MVFYTTTAAPSFRSHDGTKDLKLVAKCYAPYMSSPNGLTLLFYHCTASHKEVWEPTIDALLEMQHPATGAGIVREAWAFDMQGCGEAAILNEVVLSGDEFVVGVEDWAAGIKAFVATGRLEGHKLVAVGHSIGACLVPFTMVADGYPPVPYETIVLVEPSISERGALNAHYAERLQVNKAIVKAIQNRRRVWSDRAEARAFFARRLPWKHWDARVLDSFVEWTQYEQHPLHVLAVDLLSTTSPPVPIHYILGERLDLIPKWVVESVMKTCGAASIQEIPGAGHFVVQENPVAVAKAIADALVGKARIRARM